MSQAEMTEMNPDEITPADSDVRTTFPTRQPHIRWKLGLSLFTIGAGLETLIGNAFSEDGSAFVFLSMIILSTTAFLLLLWWTFLSGFAWKTRGIGLAAVGLFVVVWFSVFRVDGYYGQMWPIISYRWELTPDEKLAAFLKDQTAADNPEAVSVDDAVTTITATQQDWPQFRGPNRDGIVTNANLRIDWNSNPPQQVWRHPVGLGWSSFAIVGDYAFTQEQRKAEECVVCYNALTGKQVWVYQNNDWFTESMGGDGPRATPTFHESKLYTLGATGILNCLNAADGKKIWSRNILDDASAAGVPVKNIGWAMAGSPLVSDGMVFVNPGGKQGRGVIAYDVLSGDIVWAKGNDPASYCAPRIETVDGVRQLLIYDGFGLKGHDIATGKELWRTEWKTQPEVVAAQPIVQDGNYIFLSAGYTVGSTLIKVRHTKNGWQVDTKNVLKNKFKLKFNDGLYKAGYVYGLSEGILACFDFKTGQRMWKRGRYNYGQLLLVGDHILVQAESGEVALVEANPKAFKEVARFQAITGKTWNHPVLHRGKLYLRNAQEAACYDVGK